MIFCIFTILAAFGAGDIEIMPIVGAAVFERDFMLHDIVAAWSEFPTALATASAALKEQLGDLLICEPGAWLVMPW